MEAQDLPFLLSLSSAQPLYVESFLPGFSCFYFRLLSPLPRSLLVYNIKASFLIPLSLPSQDESTIFSMLRENKEALFTKGHIQKGLPGGSDGKESACNAGDQGSIPGSGRSSEEGNGYPVQYSCLQSPMDRGASWATVHGISQARILDWVAIPFSRTSSWPKGWTQISCIGDGFFIIWDTRKAH